MSVSSEFYKDLSKFEPTYKGGFTKNQLKLLISATPGCILLIFESLFLQGFLYYGLSVITCLLFIIPQVIKGMGKWGEGLKHLNYFLHHQEREFETRKGVSVHEEKTTTCEEAKRFRL